MKNDSNNKIWFVCNYAHDNLTIGKLYQHIDEIKCTYDVITVIGDDGNKTSCSYRYQENNILGHIYTPYKPEDDIRSYAVWFYAVPYGLTDDQLCIMEKLVRAACSHPYYRVNHNSWDVNKKIFNKEWWEKCSEALCMYVAPPSAFFTTISEETILYKCNDVKKSTAFKTLIPRYENRHKTNAILLNFTAIVVRNNLNLHNPKCIDELIAIDREYWYNVYVESDYWINHRKAVFDKNTADGERFNRNQRELRNESKSHSYGIMPFTQNEIDNYKNREIDYDMW